MLKVKNKIKKVLKSLPDKPGVYFFYGPRKQLLYIGKAKNLKKRVKSYFQKDQNLVSSKQIMTQNVQNIKYQNTNSEIEALILEACLIKKLHPRFNIDFRDDAFYPYIKITNEKFPQIFITRKKIKDTSRYFGPFVSAKDAKLVLQILRKIFPFRACRIMPQKPCLDYHIELCPGVCVNKKFLKNNLTATEVKKIYQNNIKQITCFLKNNNKTTEKILRDLKLFMQKAAENKKYELAQEFRDQMQALKNIAKHKLGASPIIIMNSSIKQDHQIQKELKKYLKMKKPPKRIEGYDISNIQGQFAVGSMVVFSKNDLYQPDKTQYRRFKIKTIKGISDTDMLKEVLNRRTNHNEWPKPDLILIDGGRPQLNTALKILKQKNWQMPVMALAKKEEELYFWREKNPLKLSPRSPLLKLLQTLRDEAHRFAISYYRKRHLKSFNEKV